MDKKVIGLNLEHYDKALCGSIVGAASLFLPYAAKDGTSLSLAKTALSLPGEGKVTFFVCVVWVLVLTGLLSAICAIYSRFRTGVGSVKLCRNLQALNTLSFTLMLFVSKYVLTESCLLNGFLNRNLSFGYFLGLIASYFTLISFMKTTKTDRGYILLTILGVIWLFPVLWILLTALRKEQGYYVGYFFPHALTFQNFVELFSHPSVLPFGRWWLNTVIVAVSACVVNTLIVLGTAYVLSRTRFAGRKPFMNILMIIGMFPGFMSLIAVYNILKGLGLNQSLMALIVVGAAGAAMGYHVTKGFFDTFPKALDEAAIIDGANRFQIFLHVILPLSKSIIVYTVLGTFLGAWSDYIFPSMLFGDKQSSYTAAFGLFWLTYMRRIETYYTQFAAGAVVVAVPIVILFIWLQQFYVDGLSGSVKG